MTEEQAKALTVGDKVRCIDNGRVGYLTEGKIYEVSGIDNEDDPFFYDDNGDREYVLSDYCGYYELVEEAPSSKYRIEIIETSECFDADGLSLVKAYVNDDLLAHLREIESEQGREAKRNKIREQIAKLEAELEAIGR